MTPTGLRKLLDALDSLPPVPVTIDYSYRGEIVSRGAMIATNCWSGVIVTLEARP